MSPEEIDLRILVFDYLPPKSSSDELFNQSTIISSTNKRLKSFFPPRTILVQPFHVHVVAISPVKLKEELSVWVDPSLVDWILIFRIDCFYWLSSSLIMFTRWPVLRADILRCPGIPNRLKANIRWSFVPDNLELHHILIILKVQRLISDGSNGVNFIITLETRNPPIFPGIVDLLNGEAEHLHILPIDILMLLIQYLEDGFLMWMIFIFDVQSITKGNLMHKLLPIYLGSLFWEYILVD